ncbi:MAG: cysteine desulfurase NifS [Christensenellales bacterium]|jgi:cysteine desulfurase
MKVYLDNSATTKIAPEVLEAMMPYLTDTFGNASSLHAFGRAAAGAVAEARSTIAKLIGADSDEIYFTSGGTESDNWAAKGAAFIQKNKSGHIITSEIEHPAMLQTMKWLEKQGFSVSYAKIDKGGFVSAEEIKRLIRDDTFLVSIMYANNEVGSIQPISEIGAICREEGILFHTDAVQAMSTIKIDVKAMNIDMLSMSAHKFNGPKGIGALYIKRGVKLDTIVAGGHQERAKRGGTTNTAAIVGMAKALEITCANMEKNNQKMLRQRDYFIDRVLKEIPYTSLNGSRENRLPFNANFSFDFIEGESILMSLDLAGIAVSSGSACSSGSLEPSHVILALQVPPEQAHSSIRFTLGHDTTDEELDYVIEKLKECVEKLRRWSPLFNVQSGEGHYV